MIYKGSKHYLISDIHLKSAGCYVLRGEGYKIKSCFFLYKVFYKVLLFLL